MSNLLKSPDEVLKSTLFNFFQRKENMDKLMCVLNRNSPVSLRLLDYFCVNYCKSHQVSYSIDDKYFDAYSSYKNQLSNFSKKKFDPFRRNSRIPLINNGKVHTTTLAQLCFFRWCLTYKILDYVEKHKNEITEDMKVYSLKQSELNATMAGNSAAVNGVKGSRPRKSKRRSELVALATRVYTTDNQETIIISFD